MEVISTNQIVDPNAQQPLTGKSLTFLQNALRKDDAGIIQALVTKIVGSYSLIVPYVIDGCVLSDSNKDVTNGTLFYGGKFYEVVGVNGTTNVARFILTKSQDITADPVTFTDGSSKNVHDIYKYVATDVASGGDFIATDLVYLASVTGKINNEVQSSTQNTTSTSFADLTSGTASTYTTPNDGKTRTWLILYSGTVYFSGSTGDGGKARIYNATSSTVLHLKESYMDIVVTNVDLAIMDINCQKIVSLAPNTTIKIQIASTNGGGIDFKNNSFVMVEL